MIYVMCAVYDKAVGVISPPQFFRSEGEAIRSFTDAVNDPGMQFGKHATDYAFMRLGSYDDATGKFDQDKSEPRKMIEAFECLKPLDELPRSK